jgi:DNA-binding transcriptional LysR family regulator
MAVFVAVVDSGSLIAAARKLRLTSSAVSKHVTRLEERLGTQLLKRTTRSMALTEAGRTFYERTSTLLAEIRDVESEVTSRNAKPVGLVRVSAPQLLSQTHVTPILLAFQKRVPSIALDLDLTDRTIDMIGERVDVAVRITSSPPPSFVARRVGVVHRVLCASPAYLKVRPAPKTPRDLAKHACLLLGGSSGAPLWHFGTPSSATAPEAPVRLDVRFRATNTQTLYEAAKAGLGIAELPRYLVETDLAARRLVRVLEAHASPGRDIYVIYPQSPFTPARVRALVNYLVPELQRALRGLGPA